MPENSRDIRLALEAKWQQYLSKNRILFSSDNLEGASPPSVFVGSYNYPHVLAGPVVPPVHGDTSLFDAPEKWAGMNLERIIRYRLNLVRGTQKVSADMPSGRYIESLQEVAMASRPMDSEIQFEHVASATISLDGQSAPFGSIGKIKSARYAGVTPVRPIEKAYYDTDLKADEAVIGLYRSGIPVSAIQKCFSIGMMGRSRRLVPTRWSITATDDIISNSLVSRILDFPMIDYHGVFHFGHLGNLFSVILFPHRWIYEMIEAWYSGGVLGFGSDHENASGIRHPPAIAGAYFAAKLGVAEYLVQKRLQAGVLILREIRPEYAIPVGVWQIREGIRRAMQQEAKICGSFDESMTHACRQLGVAQQQWLAHSNMARMLMQRTLDDYA